MNDAELTQDGPASLRPVSSTDEFAQPMEAAREETVLHEEEDVRATDQALTSNGCSNPLFTEVIQQMLRPVPASLKSLFRPACDTHDYCYASGKAFYGLSRATCDQNFGDDLLRICSNSYPFYDPLGIRQNCETTAIEFTGAVRGAGASHYEGTPCLAGQTDTTDCSTYEPYRTNAPNSKDYVLYTTTGNKTYRVAGAPNSAKTLLPDTATSLGAYAFRSGYIANGQLRLIEGDPNTAHTIYTSPATSFKVSGNRVGAIFTNSGFLLQEGALLSGWTSNISAHLFDLDQDRVVVASRGAEYAVWLKKGPTSAPWKKIRSSPNEEVQQVSVHGSRIAVTRSYKVATTDNDGQTWTEAPFLWVDETSTKMAGRRLGMVVQVGNPARWDLMVTEDDPRNKNYFRMSSYVTAWDTTSTRLAVISNGTLWLQDGGLAGTWRSAGSAQSVKLSGNRVAFVDGGVLYVKDGSINDSWTNRANWTQVATQVRDYSIWQKGDYDVKDYVNVIK